jgi:2-hydroxycyclohexanecarboxyl-CoA dehydrogenase
MRGLEDRVAFVTGSGRGIGHAIALRLATEGAKVAVADLNEATARETAAEIGERAIALSIDVIDSASVRAAVAETEQRLGPIHVLVNNSGWDKVEPFVKSEEPTWDKVLAINLKGPIACAT